MTAIIDEIDILVTGALTGLAADPHVTQWRAKETNWVNYFALQHLLPRCRPQGILSEPAQIGIESPYPSRGDIRNSQFVATSSSGLEAE
jgi:hypothetical protein